MISRILVVDDEVGMLEVCSESLRDLPDVEVVVEEDSRRAAQFLAAKDIDLLISDLRMPGLSGMDLLRVAREHDPQLPVLMLTAFPTIESAVESMKQGASDYLIKPFLPDALVAHVRRLLEENKLRQEHRLLQRQLERQSLFDEIVGKSPAMQAVFEAILRMAAADFDILILGETGTGKELVARSLHKRSRRAKGRFVPVDCGAIPENLLEGELFGHERGAFTGAYQRNMGLLEYADGGTFFLDEIGELSLGLQAKLLRVLQERKFRRIGGTVELSCDVKVVAATNRDLVGEARRGRFREELLYRINASSIRLPALRERREDIPLLASHFIDRFTQQAGKGPITLSPEIAELLSHYTWPGNVRELQNVVKHAIVHSRSNTLSPDDLPDEIVNYAGEQTASDEGSFFSARAAYTAAFERKYLVNLLQRLKGEATRAAQEAKIPRGTFYRMLKRHDLDPETFRR